MHNLQHDCRHLQKPLLVFPKPLVLGLMELSSQASVDDWLSSVPDDGGLPLSGIGRMVNLSAPGGIGNLSAQPSAPKLVNLMDQASLLAC